MKQLLGQILLIFLSTIPTRINKNCFHISVTIVLIVLNVVGATKLSSSSGFITEPQMSDPLKELGRNNIFMLEC